MKSYLLRHVDGGYLHRGPNSRWDQTLNRDVAERMTHTKAINVLNNCISPAERKNWMLEEDERSTIIVLDQATANEYADSYDWDELAQTHFQLCKELTGYSDSLRKRLSHVDLEINDIQHYIEFFNLDAAKGYKAYRMLKECLERRRHIKQELARVTFFLSGSAADHAIGKVDRQIRAVEDRTYSPRILEELFALDQPPPTKRKCEKHDLRAI